MRFLSTSRGEFDLLLRVDASGSVDQTLAKPATNLAECVRTGLEGWKGGTLPVRASG